MKNSDEEMLICNVHLIYIITLDFSHTLYFNQQVIKSAVCYFQSLLFLNKEICVITNHVHENRKSMSIFGRATQYIRKTINADNKLFSICMVWGCTLVLKERRGENVLRVKGPYLCKVETHWNWRAISIDSC